MKNGTTEPKCSVGARDKTLFRNIRKIRNDYRIKLGINICLPNYNKCGRTTHPVACDMRSDDIT